MIAIEVNGDALSGTEAGSGLLAAVTRDGRQQVRDLTHLTDRVIEGQRDEPESFLQRIVHLSTTLPLALPGHKRQLRSLDGGGTVTGDY